MFQELPQPKSQSDMLLITGGNFAVNLEILLIVRETLAINRQNAEMARIRAQNDLTFYEQALKRMDEISEKLTK